LRSSIAEIFQSGSHRLILDSQAVQLVAHIGQAVLAGEDLAKVIDRHANEHDVRSRQGAFGVLTAGVLTRADAYVQAVVTALAPWYASQRPRG